MMYQKKLQHDIHIFIGIVFTLLIIGCLFIYSSSSVFALETYGNSHYFLKRQLIGLTLGIIALIIATIIPLPFIKKISPLMFAGALTLTALTLLPQLAPRVYGSHRWLNIAGFSFQPSELLKIALLIYLAYFLEKKSGQPLSFLSMYLPLILIVGLSSLILLKQPDFGMTITLVLTVLILLFIAQINLKHLMIVLACLIPMAIGLILMRPYRLQRILTFLNPWQDPQGAGFQVIQSLIAIGSGGVSGAGIAHSKQKFFYLPMQHSDFIFAIIAEETGFIGSIFIIMLYAAFLYLGFRIAWQLNNTFSLFVTIGFTSMISLQAIINLAVVTGLAPTKGLGLPFISYGSTSLICNLFMIGLILNMTRQTQKTT
jgi:cell division protein FtsW